MDAIATNKIPTMQECIQAMSEKRGQLTQLARVLGNDSFSKKSLDNKKKMKEIEQDLERLKYDERDVKRMAMRGGDGKLMTNEEKNNVICCVGQLYMISMLLENVMQQTFGEQLRKKGEGGEIVYEYCQEMIDNVANFLRAFTDRFTWNVSHQAKELFDADLDVSKLCTDIDILSIQNVTNAFGTRFVKAIAEQEEKIKIFLAEQEKQLEKEKVKLAKKIRKEEQ